MANDKLNPQAITPKWGGVITLTLGKSKPENFDEIYNELKQVVASDKLYTILVKDSGASVNAMDARVLKDSDGETYYIRVLNYTSAFIQLISYIFYSTGTYTRTTKTLVSI